MIGKVGIIGRTAFAAPVVAGRPIRLLPEDATERLRLIISRLGLDRGGLGIGMADTTERTGDDSADAGGGDDDGGNSAAYATRLLGVFGG